MNKIKRCSNCINYQDNLCNALNDTLLINIRVFNSKGVEVYDHDKKYSIMIKDKHKNNFYCKYFKERGN